jgi:hypothetical protein
VATQDGNRTATCAVTVSVPTDSSPYYEDRGYGTKVSGGTGSIPKQNGWTRYEAELSPAVIMNSSRTGNDPRPGVESGAFWSNGEAAGGLNKTTAIANINSTTNWSTLSTIAYVKFTVTVAQAGKYQVNIIYNGDLDNKQILVKLNNNSHNAVSLPQQDNGSSSWNSVFTRQITLGTLAAGTNTIWVSGTLGSASS